MKPGSELVPFVIEASPQSMREWSVFLADPNQIHLEVEAVKALGLGDRLINQGPANLAYVMNLLAANFPGLEIEAIDCRFTGNVFAGDRCIANGLVTEVSDERIICEVWLDIEGAGKAITGTARLRRKPA